jgi:hypothetical protein
MKPGENKILDQPIRPAPAGNQYRKLEAQAARTRQAFERLEHSETKLKTSAIQILLAILRHAVSQDDPAD